MSLTGRAAVQGPSQRWDPPLPGPRGSLTACLFEALTGSPDRPGGLGPLPPVTGDPLADDDLHLALYACYELHYRGFAGVDPRWEWDAALLAGRRRMEDAFESALRDTVGGAGSGGVGSGGVGCGGVVTALQEIANRQGPPLSRYLRDTATLSEVEEYVVHRSAYQLKEADPHALLVPRLEGAPKAALVEVLFDELGCGAADRIHAVLYRNTMDAMGLDSRYGAYLDAIPGPTLATVNFMSLVGLHRRLTPAAVGHLAVAELTSSLANKNVAEGLRRLGYGAEATAFFDEHVLADSVHDMIALHDVAGVLAEEDPTRAGEIVFGACAWAGIDAAFAQSLLDRWAAAEPSLLRLSGLPGRPGP